MKSFTQIARALFIVTTSIACLFYQSISSADVVLTNSQQQEYLIADLLTAKEMFSTVVFNDRAVPNLATAIGSYTHSIDFNADFKSFVHIHPLGNESLRVLERGGPQLEFHVNPNQIGFIKLFAQVKIKGKEIFVPFGIVVNPKRFSPG
ncbi:hypothetical protein [Legionella drancourtii]|uniref:Uncharacterized protein n=1 Tax=Legionella drancourtii LLAP12 TaxID=658187 RepID=G9ETH1_9GAMM|nr:hypothetical protein [Legionella drancourtii]EHL29638.1 hypothetical protein LDG_8603 [Legionella drancourtii LLAP12]